MGETMDHTTYTVFSSSNVKGWGWSRRRGFSYAEACAEVKRCRDVGCRAYMEAR